MTNLKSTEQQLQSTLDSTYRNKNPIRTLWRLFESRRPQMFMAVVMYVIKQSPVWVLPIVTGSIITLIANLAAVHHDRQPINPADIHSIILYAGLMFLLIAQNVPTHTLYSWLLSSAVRHIQLVLRSAIVVRLQQLSMSFHDNVQSGKLQSKVLRDVEGVENLCRLLIESVLANSISLTVPIAITLWRAPSVTVFFLITVPMAVMIARVFRHRLRARNEEFRREVEEMSGKVAEMIEMIPITRAHAVEGTEVERLHVQLLRIRHSGRRLDTVNNLFGSSAWATFQTFQMFCFMFNIYQCYIGKITVGDVVMYQAFFTMVLNAVQGFLNLVPQLTAGQESMRSIGEVLESPDVEQNDGKSTVNAVNGQFTFDHVGYLYPSAEKASIEDFNMTISAGECVAVVGESGSGKSTLMNLIIGFRRPTSGKILLDGVDMATINFRSFRRFLAVVPQQTVLFSGSIRDNITYGLKHVTDAQLKSALDMANCSEFVNRLPKGLDTSIGSHGGKLSGGQRQRIAIARALLRDPRIIILDEATSALDVQSEFLVQEAINRLIAGRTTFIVAHRLSTIRHANRIVVMKNGRMVESGTHDELLSRSESAFSKLHALQT